MGNNMELDYEMFCYQCEQTANQKGAPSSVYAEKLPKSQICRIFNLSDQGHQPLCQTSDRKRHSYG